MQISERLHQFVKDNLCAFATVVHPGFVAANHHKLLASKLEAVERGQIKRLCVFMPPRHGKSLTASQIFPAWYLGRNPTKRVLSLSYGQDLADVFGRFVRNTLRSEAYLALFPESKLSSDSSSIKRFNVELGGGYAAIGAGGAITGRGADLLLLDDLIKSREDADSPLHQKTLQDWFTSVAYTRLQKNGAIVLVMTRWGTADFAAWCLQELAHEKWEIINLPAIATSNDPLGRQAGDSLWPEQYDKAALEDIATTLGSRDWNSLYQQCPVADGDVIFGGVNPQIYHRDPEDIARSSKLLVHSWDLSFGGTGTTSSWVVGQVWAVFATNNKDHFYLVDQFRDQCGFLGSIQAIKVFKAKYPKGEVLIENKANGPAAIEALKEQIKGILPIDPKGGKVDRAYKALPLFEQRRVWLPDPLEHTWVKPLLTELGSFPQGVTDDCIDAATMALDVLGEQAASYARIKALIS